MTKRNRSDEIELGDPGILQQLGLKTRNIEGGCEYFRTEMGVVGPSFPYCLEEAAYMLVGLKWSPEAPRLAPLRLREFLSRGGHEVFCALGHDLESGLIQSLSLEHILSWVKERRERLLFCDDLLVHQMESLVNALRDGHAPLTVSRKRKGALKATVEREIGYSWPHIIYNPQTGEFRPKVPGRGRKGHSAVRKRNMARALADELLAQNPKTTRREAYESPELNFLLEGNLPEYTTFVNWTEGMRFFVPKSPGRPRKSVRCVK